jgi:large subunit ribosomal protein L4
MKIKVSNISGQSVGECEIADTMLEPKRGAQALQEALTAYRANQRAGSASTKTKGEVAGNGMKPWRQKGTGRARAGYRQSPIWRGGGVVFGPKPRDYTKQMNKQVSRLALRRALTDKLSGGQVIVVDQFTVAAPKTKHVVEALGKLQAGTKALLVLDQVPRDVTLAARNLPTVEVVSAANLNVYQLSRYPSIVMSQAALGQLEKRLAAG